jgi:hypothetical protein
VSERLMASTLAGEGESRAARIMRVLAASRRGMSTPDLVDALGEEHGSRQRILTLYGQALRERLASGQVIRAARTPGGHREGPAVIWNITPAGRDALRRYDREVAARRARLAGRAAGRAAAAVQVKALALTAAAVARTREAGCRVSAEDRQAQAIRLRALGCSLQAIGDVCGVSRECIRLDLLPDAGLDARRAAIRDRYRRNAAAAKAGTS